jgi:multiple sugar transport system substrate-binding protein
MTDRRSRHHITGQLARGALVRRRRFRRSVGVTALAGALGLAVAACGSGAASGQGTYQGTLTISLQSYAPQIIKPAVDAFQKIHPGVKIQESVVSAAGTTYLTTLLTQRLSGNLPDIVEPQDVLSPTLAADGITQSLTPYMKSGKLPPQSYFLPNILSSYIPEAGQYKGQVMALPDEADAVVVYYNENEFKAAGVPFPKDNWTWSDMMADAAKLKKFSHGVQTQWGICDAPDWQAMYNPLMKAFGAASLTETKADLASPGALKAWQMLIQPTTDGTAVPYSTYLSAASDCSTLFNSGQAAMLVDPRNTTPVIQPAAEGKFVFNAAPMPYVNGVNGPVRPTGAGSIGWGITTQAGNVPLALAFLNFLVSQQGQSLLEKGYGVIPATSAALQPSALWQHLPPPPANNQAFITAAKTGIIAPQTPNSVYNLVLTDVPKAIQAVVDNHESYAQAFGQLNSAVNAAYASSSGS